MKLNKKQRRTAKKFALPLIALGMMMTAAFIGAANRSHTSTSYKYPSGSAARLAPDLHHR